MPLLFVSPTLTRNPNPKHMLVQEVDEQYCISYVFKGDWKAKLRGQGQIISPDGGSLTKVTVKSDDINEDGEEKVVGTFSGLTIGGDYTLEVKEDAVLGAPHPPTRCCVHVPRLPTRVPLARAAKAPRKIFVASGGMSGRQDNFSASVGMGEDSSSCSCLFGCVPRPSRHTHHGSAALPLSRHPAPLCRGRNPCASSYNCKDWHNRNEVAKKNGWKGFS